jgi:hypothetical protein
MARNFIESFVDKVIDKLERRKGSTFYLISQTTPYMLPVIHSRIEATSREDLCRKFSLFLGIDSYYFLIFFYEISDETHYLFSQKFHDIFQKRAFPNDSDFEPIYMFMQGILSSSSNTIDKYEELNDDLKSDIEYILREYDEKIESAIQEIDTNIGLDVFFDQNEWELGGLDYILIEDKCNFGRKLTDKAVNWADDDWPLDRNFNCLMNHLISKIKYGIRP